MPTDRCSTSCCTKRRARTERTCSRARCCPRTIGGTTKSFRFPNDLPSAATAGKRVLIASQGFAALNLIKPDYTIPDRFLATDAGRLDYAGVNSFAYAALPTDGVSALFASGAGGPNVAANFTGQSVAVTAAPITVVEYYNTALDHYFISPLAPDINALDMGLTRGWTRTGLNFKAYPSQASGGAGVNPVCRFYIRPQHGSSHFFTASAAECNEVVVQTAINPSFSGYVFETPAAFYIALPDTTTGTCPAGTVPVYRLWNQRFDSNHRFTTDASVKSLMVASGYFAEGYGPDRVAMCTSVQSRATRSSWCPGPLRSFQAATQRRLPARCSRMPKWNR